MADHLHSPVTPSGVRLPDLLHPDAIILDLQAQTKDAAILELCDLLEESGLVQDRFAAVRSVREREASLSTGIGHGIAVPHGRFEGMEFMSVAIGISRAGVDWSAEDGVPAHLIFLLVGPEHAHAQYLKLLAQIAHLARLDNFRSAFLACQTPRDVMLLIRGSFAAITRH